MELRIVVADAASGSALAERLALSWGTDRISLSGDRREVGVAVERESDRAVLHIVEAVESWLDQAGIASAELWLGQHSYKLARWAAARPEGHRDRSHSTRPAEGALRGSGGTRPAVVGLEAAI